MHPVSHQRIRSFSVENRSIQSSNSDYEEKKQESIPRNVMSMCDKCYMNKDVSEFSLICSGHYTCNLCRIENMAYCTKCFRGYTPKEVEQMHIINNNRRRINSVNSRMKENNILTDNKIIHQKNIIPNNSNQYNDDRRQTISIKKECNYCNINRDSSDYIIDCNNHNVCNFCRIKNPNNCIKCKKAYTPDEKELIDCIIQSVRTNCNKCLKNRDSSDFCISCENHCICNYCRLENQYKCIKCNRNYDGPEGELLDRIKISLGNKSFPSNASANMQSNLKFLCDHCKSYQDKDKKVLNCKRHNLCKRCSNQGNSCPLCKAFYLQQAKICSQCSKNTEPLNSFKCERCENYTHSECQYKYDTKIKLKNSLCKECFCEMHSSG